MVDPLILEAGDARVEIAPDVGGAIASFTFQGRDVMRPTPAWARESGDVRVHASYPLIPYSNRIRFGQLAFQGETHRLDLNYGTHPHAIHGVGWQRPWRVEDATDRDARIALAHDPAASEREAGAWPWAFRATQAFALRSDGEGTTTLAQKLTIENTGTAPFPFGLGWHPFFSTTPASVLGFRASGVWLTDDTIIPTEHVAPSGHLSFDPPRAIGKAPLDNGYTDWRGDATFEDADRDLRVVLRADSACTFLVVYVPADGSPFVVVEPVTHMTDGFNRLARGDAHTGTRILDAGDAFTAAMDITVSGLSGSARPASSG